MKLDKNCPKCKKPILEICHFHEPDHLGIQSIIYHNKKIVSDLFGGEHEVFNDACFLTEIEYQNLKRQTYKY